MRHLPRPLDSVADKMLFIRLFFKNFAQWYHRQSACRPRKTLNFAIEANDQHALALLRQSKMQRVQNPKINKRIKIPENFEDALECFAFVMRNKLLHVFQNECLRAFRLKDAGQVEKQCAASVCKPATVAND